MHPGQENYRFLDPYVQNKYKEENLYLINWEEFKFSSKEGYLSQLKYRGFQLNLL